MTAGTTGTQILPVQQPSHASAADPAPSRPPAAGPSGRVATLVLAGALVAGTLTGLATAVGTGAHRGGDHGRSAGGTAGTPLHPAQVTLVDASGGDDPQGVANAVDGNPATAWTTEWYASPTFGNLKPGVGLLVDFGHAVTVRSARLLMSVSGAGVELFAAGQPLSGGPTGAPLASVPAAPAQTVLSVSRPVSARYWLVWIDRLAPTSSGYQAGIADMAFSG